MLDLLPLKELRPVLDEFRRVLKPGGRLSLVNFSKESDGKRSLYESAYSIAPSFIVPYMFGGCRPVFIEGLAREAGFLNVRREFVKNIVPAEVVTAEKPGR